VLKSDYEDGIRKGFLAVYPSARQEGDSFHLHQLLMKRVKDKEKFLQEYRRDLTVYFQVYYQLGHLNLRISI
jgi:hypothetical protein